MILGAPGKYKILKIRSIWFYNTAHTVYELSTLCISPTIRFYAFVMLHNEQFVDLYGIPMMILYPKKKYELCEEIFL